MDSLEVERVSIAFVACAAGHRDRLLLGVSCGKDTKSAAKLNSLPSSQRPHDLDSVYWTLGPTWKSSDGDAGKDLRVLAVRKREVKNKIMQSQLFNQSKTNLNLVW